MKRCRRMRCVASVDSSDISTGCSYTISSDERCIPPDLCRDAFPPIRFIRVHPRSLPPVRVPFFPSCSPPHHFQQSPDPRSSAFSAPCPRSLPFRFPSPSLPAIHPIRVHPRSLPPVRVPLSPPPHHFLHPIRSAFIRVLCPLSAFLSSLPLPLPITSCTPSASAFFRVLVRRGGPQNRARRLRLIDPRFRFPVT